MLVIEKTVENQIYINIEYKGGWGGFQEKLVDANLKLSIVRGG